MYDNSFRKTLSGVYKEVNWDEFEKIGTQMIVEGSCEFSQLGNQKAGKNKSISLIFCAVFSPKRKI